MRMPERTTAGAARAAPSPIRNPRDSFSELALTDERKATPDGLVHAELRPPQRLRELVDALGGWPAKVFVLINQDDPALERYIQVYDQLVFEHMDGKRPLPPWVLHAIPAGSSEHVGKIDTVGYQA